MITVDDPCPLPCRCSAPGAAVGADGPGEGARSVELAADAVDTDSDVAVDDVKMLDMDVGKTGVAAAVLEMAVVVVGGS